MDKIYVLEEKALVHNCETAINTFMQHCGDMGIDVSTPERSALMIAVLRTYAAVLLGTIQYNNTKDSPLQ